MRRPFPFALRLAYSFFRVLLLSLASFGAHVALAEPLEINLPAQAADSALLLFSQQTKTEVLFSSQDLHRVRSTEVVGRLEPEDALIRLLQGTGFTARRSTRGKFIIRPAAPATGAIKGRLLEPGGQPALGVRVTNPDTQESALTGEHGEFAFNAVPPGTYRLIATGEGFQSLHITDVRVDPNRTLVLDTQTLQELRDPARLEPFVVKDRSGRSGLLDRDDKLLPVRTAVGNSDLRRTEDDALPYTVYDRRQLVRSGVVNLNEFLQRELLDTDAATRSADQDGSKDSFVSSSANLSLRGYSVEETVVLVNGRRLPEVLTSGATPMLPDVNFIPLSLVQQVEVLPVSASALYTGNAVGGVINIVLRPDVDAAASEVTVTYTNAMRGFDAPQSSVSVLHAQTLLGGALRVRFNASLTSTMPPTEAELRYHQSRDIPPATLDVPIYRATPNIRSADGSPLFAQGSSTVTSVAPGADGNGGLSPFNGREGLRNVNFFDAPGGLAPSLDSIDYGYGRRQQRDTYFGSVVYDLTSWLQLGVDATYSQTVSNRGYDVLRGDLTLNSDSPLNPFHQDVLVSLNETASALGENYSEARLQYASAVFGALVKLPAAWRLSADAQYAHNVTKYRGLAGVSPERWQQLVDDGRYNPLRDTQVHGPPSAFYNEVVIYRGGLGRFSTLGDYDTLDLALRATNEDLVLPTGRGAINVGADYRSNHLSGSKDERRFADGTYSEEPIRWNGRTLQRYSVFGELQAPLLSERWQPRWIRRVESDLAVRYIAAYSSKESNVAPTYGLKVNFAGGLSLRGSLTTSNRLPTPYMSHKVMALSSTPGSNVDYVSILDPRRNQTYLVQPVDDLNPDVRPEAAVTQTAGLLFQRGGTQRLRASLDFVDTRKTNELFALGAQTVVDLEHLWPERVNRAPLASGDTQPVGKVTSVLTGITNLAWRHSQNWNVSLNYAWTQCLGGTLELYTRVLYFQRYDLQGLPNSPVVDELRHPDGGAPGLSRIRTNYGVGWSNRDIGFGIDGHYFYERNLPATYWAGQGSNHIAPFNQFDAYLQSDLGRWLPWRSSRFGLRAQLRVNNLFEAAFPKYVNEPSASGVEPYGDWRGRTYSVSMTAMF